ncbi:hypothetical protein M0R36_06060 [bacterium]|nr:hypothetical protein [bacterium]
MKRLSLILILLAVVLCFFSGCATPKGGTSMPWSTPASWESNTAIQGGSF